MQRLFDQEEGVTVEIVDARKELLADLKGITDPEGKHKATTQTFYRNVFGRLDLPPSLHGETAGEMSAGGACAAGIAGSLHRAPCGERFRRGSLRLTAPVASTTGRPAG